MADEDLGTGSLTVELDVAGTTAQLLALSQRMQSILDSASKKAARKVTQNLKNGLRRVEPGVVQLANFLERELSRAARNAGRSMNVILREALADLSDQRVVVEVEADITEAQLEIGRLNDERIEVVVDADLDNFRAAMQQATSEGERSSSRLSAAFGGIGKALGSLGKASSAALAIGAIGISAASAAQSVISLTAALAPAAGIVAALPAAALGAVAAFGALKLALSGVGDAFGAALTGDSKKFEKALEGLSPAARTAAREVRALKPVFDQLKNSVQDAFFKGFEGDITRVAKALAGPLKTGLTAISAEWGRAASGVAGYLQGAKGVSNVTSILNAARAGVAGLADSANKLTAGFLQVAASVSDAFGSQVQSGISNLGQKFGTFLQQLASSGRAVELVENALVVFAQLGDIVANVGSIIGSVFKAANQVGGGFLNNIREVTDSVRELAASAQGQKALINVFTALSIAAEQLGPIISAAVTAVGEIAPGLIPVFEALGPAIALAIGQVGVVITRLLPLVQAFATQLLNAFTVLANSGVLGLLATAISNIGVVLTPLLPLIAQVAVALGTALVPVIASLQPVIAAAVAVIQSLVPVILPLIEVAGQLATQIGPVLTPVVQAVSDTLDKLAPVVAKVAELFLNALSPVLDKLPALLNPVLQLFGEITDILFPVLLRLLDAVSPSIDRLSETFVRLADELAPVLTEMGRLAAQILNDLTPLLDPLIELVAQLAAIFADNLASTIDEFVIPALRAMAAIMKGDSVSASREMQDAIEGLGKTLLRVLFELPGNIAIALGDAGKAMISVGVDIINGLITGINKTAKLAAKAAVDAVSGAIDSAKDFLGISSPSKAFAEIGKFSGQGLVRGLNSMNGAVAGAAASMAGAALSPFAGAAPQVASPAFSSSANGFTGSGAQSAVFAPARGLAAAQQGRTVINNFTIQEVGSADTTAQRVISRLVMQDGGL